MTQNHWFSPDRPTDSGTVFVKPSPEPEPESESADEDE